MSNGNTTTTTTRPGPADVSSWGSSETSFAPNTNVLDPETMPSTEAQNARDKTERIMAALKAGDTATANALLGKDETKGRILPGMGWLKKKVNARKDGKDPKGGEEEQGKDGYVVR